MKNSKYHFLSLLLVIMSLSNSFSSFSQNTIHVDSAIGICYISNITPEQAKKTAIIEAKNEALLQAGVSENVMVYSTLETFSTNDTNIEYFSSLTNIVSKGQIVGWDILKERKYINEQNNFVYEVVIQADVIKYKTKPDPNFSADISGVRPVYYEGELLEFNSLMSQNGYVYVFLLNDGEASQLFPNSYEQEHVFETRLQHKFPTDDNIEYKLTLDGNETSKNTLVYVMTKKSASPLVSNSKSLFQWLYAMEPDQVFYGFYPINILKK